MSITRSIFAVLLCFLALLVMPNVAVAANTILEPEAAIDAALTRDKKAVKPAEKITKESPKKAISKQAKNSLKKVEKKNVKTAKASTLKCEKNRTKPCGKKCIPIQQLCPTR